MRGKNVVVVGGSIAGCALAILLQRLGANVSILEQSSGRIGQGSGITLPEAVINQCIENDLFDADIPRLLVTSRSFIRKNEQETPDIQVFWKQAIQVMTLNWVDVYQNLRKRVESINYYTNAEVCHLEETQEGCLVKTSDGTVYNADLVIAADGIDSTVRAHLLPNAQPEYAGYVAWRGVMDNEHLNSDKLFHQHIPYSVYPHGHILLYRIPGAKGKTLLNWVMYEDRRGRSLNSLLIDNEGNQRTYSLPAGTLTVEHMQYLHNFVQVLPTAIKEIIMETSRPFLQAIFDFHLPPYASNRVIFVGDAAATLRPHTASGVFKALANGFELINLIENNPGLKLTDYVSLWKQNQQQQLVEETQKAKAMGEALVSHTPDWHLMDQESMDAWWAKVMQGKIWYATNNDEA
ncbi:FAD binding domain-containing protein [Legionella saoudiensis]|uniref:FAD binding domain-containing protein n=1 Tax=Legionella saoudiensis TaxID=1750561 RepID=UPI00072FAA2A|nr:FAD-dependent monooxygenase [Legionella saoudiensis]